MDRPVRTCLLPPSHFHSSDTGSLYAQNSLTGSTEVGIAIGLWPCGGPKGTSKCASTDVSQVLGNVVYTGSYKPAYDSKAPTKPPHQNFDITIPSSFSKGEVSLGIAHLSLVGVSIIRRISQPKHILTALFFVIQAGSEPTYEFTNITLVVS